MSVIFSYIISNPDESPVLSDALTSLAKFSDRIYLIDGGLLGGTMIQRPTVSTPLRYWLGASDEVQKVIQVGNRWVSKWNGVPLILIENTFLHPAAQRNFALDIIEKEPEPPDWIVWIDSDEICSNEFAANIRPYLDGVSLSVTNICPKWLTLVGNETLYFPEYSSWLSHARIHRPKTARFSGQWHEHMDYTGERAEWNEYIIHTRMLYRERLYNQRGHARLNEGVWSGVNAKPIPQGVTFDLTWLDYEMRDVPFDADIRTWRP